MTIIVIAIIVLGVVMALAISRYQYWCGYIDGVCDIGKEMGIVPKGMTSDQYIEFLEERYGIESKAWGFKKK